MKLTQLRSAVLYRIVADNGRHADSFTKAGKQALAALARDGLVQPNTSNPTAEPLWVVTDAGRRALGRSGL